MPRGSHAHAVHEPPYNYTKRISQQTGLVPSPEPTPAPACSLQSCSACSALSRPLAGPVLDGNPGWADPAGGWKGGREGESEGGRGGGREGLFL